MSTATQARSGSQVIHIDGENDGVRITTPCGCYDETLNVSGRFDIRFDGVVIVFNEEDGTLSFPPGVLLQRQPDIGTTAFFEVSPDELIPLGPIENFLVVAIVPGSSPYEGLVRPTGRRPYRIRARMRRDRVPFGQ